MFPFPSILTPPPATLVGELQLEPPPSNSTEEPPRITIVADPPPGILSWAKTSFIITFEAPSINIP